MKLHQHTSLYLSVSLLVIIAIWASVFYYNMLEEVYDSIDDGLANSKMLIIQKTLRDSTILEKHDFDESNYAIRQLTNDHRLAASDRYTDTLMVVQNDNDDEPVRMLTTVFGTTDGKFYELKVISSMVEEGDLLRDLLMAMCFMYLSMLACIILVNNLILRRIWRPFYGLLGSLQKFRLGKDESFTPPPAKVDEFNQLNETMKALLHRNMEVYESQKQFIADAAHELQTPIAISINKLELLVERNSLDDETASNLGGVIANLERLKKLNRALLLISKIENHQYVQDETVVDFNALAKAQLEHFTEMMAFREVRWSYSETGSLFFPMNGYLAEVLLNNLLKNAIFHNVPEGEILVGLHPHQLRIENTGVAAPLHETKIFERFYKESSEKNSNGLGLYIAKSIASLYGIALQYRFEERHVFLLDFPH